MELKPDAARPLVHEGRLVSLAAGKFRVTLTAENADLGPEKITARLYVQEPKTPELNDLSANRQLLTQVAEASGGRLFSPDEAGQIPTLLQPPTESTSIHNEIPLWDHWLVPALLCALLTIECIIRKLNDLP